jgi:hypothetical protein
MKQTLIGFLGLGAVFVIAVLLTSGPSEKAKPLHLEGEVNDVRVEKLTDGAHVALLYLTATNPSKKPFEIKLIDVKIGPEKYSVDGGVLSKRELASLLEFKKLKDQDPAIGPGDVVMGGETVHGMLGVRFEKGVEDLETANFRLYFHNVNDLISEIKSKDSK